MNKEFKKQGWLEVDNSKNKMSYDRTNWYRLNLVKINDDLKKIGYHLPDFREIENKKEEVSETAPEAIFHGGRPIPKGSSESLEEEEKTSHSELVQFLLSKDITLENALIFENKLLEIGLAGFTYDQVIEALELSFRDFVEGHCNSPYKWAVGKLKHLMDGSIQSAQKKPIKPNKQQKQGEQKPIRTEMLPEWFDENETQQPAAEQNKKNPEQAKRELEDMLKRLRA